MRKYVVNIFNKNNGFRLLICSAALYIKLQREKKAIVNHCLKVYKNIQIILTVESSFYSNVL